MVLYIFWAPLVLFAVFAFLAIWMAPPAERWKVAIIVLRLLRGGRQGDGDPTASLGRPDAGKEARERERQSKPDWFLPASARMALPPNHEPTSRSAMANGCHEILRRTETSIALIGGDGTVGREDLPASVEGSQLGQEVIPHRLLARDAFG